MLFILVQQMTTNEGTIYTAPGGINQHPECHFLCITQPFSLILNIISLILQSVYSVMIAFVDKLLDANIFEHCLVGSQYYHCVKPGAFAI